MRCSSYGRDIDAIGQDNVSYVPGSPLCEDCAAVSGDSGTYPEEYENEEYE